VKALGKGILINGWIGGNFNGTTGDFSYGIMGLLVENGRIVKPLNEMNLTGNFLDLWTRLERLGGDPELNSAWRSPSLLFRGLQLSGS
jgi:PmbA protein